MDNQVFLQNIRNICKKKGISVSQIETDLKWSPGLISRWSRACPSFDKVAAIVDYLGVSFESLLENDDSPPEELPADNLIQRLVRLLEEGIITWSPCESDDMAAKLAESLADNGCIVNQSYYFAYQEGYFFLAMAEDDILPFSPRLYISPDKTTPPLLQSDDRVALGPLFSYADKELYTSWVHSKVNQFIKRFLKDTE